MRRPNRIIVPQYLPPPGLSLVAAAELLEVGKRAIAAQVVDFAVRRILTINRMPGRGSKDGFVLELRPSPGEVSVDELEVLTVLFGSDLRPGARCDLHPRRNRQLGQRLRDPHRRITARLVAAGFARERGSLAKVFTPWRKQPVAPTELAHPLVDHLWGIHDYVKLAERDRFAALQAPGTVATREIGDLEKLLINERLLPYAVLFGLEREWMQQLALQSQDLPPELLTSDALSGIGDLALFVAESVEGLEALADLAEIVEAADVLEGVGAIFGGIGDLLGSLGDLG